MRVVMPVIFFLVYRFFLVATSLGSRGIVRKKRSTIKRRKKRKIPLSRARGQRKNILQSKKMVREKWSINCRFLKNGMFLTPELGAAI